MAELIVPKQSRREKFNTEIRAFSPQVKAAFISVCGAFLLAAIAGIGGCIGTHSENSRLKVKVHDLEIEVMPFRNLAVQEFNKADAESMRKLAELMTTLRKDYAANLDTLNSHRLEIEQLKQASEGADRRFFSNMAEETFRVSDTNDVVVLTFSNGATQVFFILKHTPILSSLQGTMLSPTQQLPIVGIGNERNVAFTYFHPGQSFNDMKFILKYHIDKMATNSWNRVTILDGKVFMDGVRIWFKQNE